MAENFRNKQWFKNLSQERKNKICETFDISENMLKHAGRQKDDGSIVIDLLRINHIEHHPDEWKEYCQLLKNFQLTIKDSTLSDFDICKKIYMAFVPDAKILKYKDNLHNNLLIESAYKYTKKWYLKFIDPQATQYDKEFYAYQVWTHVKGLIESDLNLIK